MPASIPGRGKGKPMEENQNQIVAQTAKKPKAESRTARWDLAVTNAQAALEAVEAALSDFDSALDELREVHAEYEEWRDNLPESLSSSPTGEMLEALCEIDLSVEVHDTAYSELETLVEACAEAELPRGFGRG